MGVEIERKFLVKGEAWRALGKPSVIRQGYLSRDPQRTVRVRIRGGKAFLTVKGPNTGAVRSEFEYPIPVMDAEAMLETLALRPLIEKTRTCVRIGTHTWEIDCFFGENEGLTVAEAELTDENEALEKPEWIGREVTHLTRYFNSSLSEHPYSAWSQAEKDE